MHKKTKIIISIVLVVAILSTTVIVAWSNSDSDSRNPLAIFRTNEPTPTPPPMDMPMKPVIYLYPTQTSDVTVLLNYNGVLDFTYPAYKNGWRVTAHPDGTLINHDDGKEYSYLFWEGHGAANYDFSKGFVVRGEDTVAFLQDKLAYMGLSPNEYNEFIVYWFPRMQNNPHNLITFQGDAYTETAELIVTPQPDSVLRVFMAYKSLETPVELPNQELLPFKRHGFTVIEWGGSKIFDDVEVSYIS